MRNRNKAGGVVGTISRKYAYGWLYTLQSTNGMHPPVRITSETIGRLVY